MTAPAKTFCEFFAGIGLVRAGLEPSGWECVYANDICPKKKRMYESQFGESAHFHLADVTSADAVAARIEGSPFLATASFPCTDLSVAGHYRGFGGRYSSTFFGFIEAMRLLGRRRPKLVMLENVAGFLSARKGEDFKSAANALADLGYWLDAFVIDASRFVPQSRPRVFVIGMTAALRPSRPNIPEFPSVLRPDRIIRFMDGLELATGWAPVKLPELPSRASTLGEFIDQDEEQEWWTQEEVDRHYRMMSDLHRGRVDKLLSTRAQWVGTIFRRIRHKNQRAEVRFDGLAGCLRTPKGGSGRQIVVTTANGRLRMRWMSPREYARLQGAPDFPLRVGNHIQQLWGFADAVCVPAIAWIDKHVLTPLFNSSGSGNGGQPHAGAAAQNNGSGEKPRHLPGKNRRIGASQEGLPIPALRSHSARKA